jgi:hypothetical protein
MMHDIKISTGELLDRMSILEIKIHYLEGDKKNECSKEYNSIAVPIHHPNYQYYYRLLIYINEEIWVLQSTLHNNPGLADIAKDYKEILLLNDRRFRVKQKINALADAEINEQKEYGPKKCVVLGHLGMGDMYWMNGAVRFFSTVYDEIIIPCKIHNVENTTAMYADDTTIKILPIEGQIKAAGLAPAFPDHVMIACGLAVDKVRGYPACFYRDMDIPTSYRTRYFHHADNIQSELMFSQLVHEDYIVVHESKSSASCDIVKHLNPDRQLVLNIGRNVYPKAHPYYDLAQKFVGLPLAAYIDTLQNAEELHLIESSLACLAIHLDLSQVKVKKVYKASQNFIELGVFEGA